MKDSRSKMTSAGIALAILLVFAPSTFAQTACDYDKTAHWLDQPIAWNFYCGLIPRDSVGHTEGQPPWPEFAALDVLVTLSGGYWIGDAGGNYTTQGSPGCSPQNFSPVLKIHFSKPVRNVSIGVWGGWLYGHK